MLKYVTPILSTGFAMFSMFFGSGNIVFPVLIGQATKSQSVYAIIGLLITAVFVPFLGVFAMFLYNGSYVTFFKRLGSAPAWCLILMIMTLIGPLAVIPRCIVISFLTVQTFMPSIDFFSFSVTSCFLIYFCSINRSKVVDILGVALTPLLLCSLGLIIIKGLTHSATNNVGSVSKMGAFLLGLKEGYNMMDLFAAFMFSGLIINNIKKKFFFITSKKHLLILTVISSLIGMLLLGLIYTGMCFVASAYSPEIKNISSTNILSTLTLLVLGDGAGVVVCCSVSLACLTTAVTLSVVFSEFLSKELSFKIPYKLALGLTLIVTLGVSFLGFEGIQAFLSPILVVSLPSLILMTILNILHKLIKFNLIKLPVFFVFFISLVCYFI